VIRVYRSGCAVSEPVDGDVAAWSLPADAVWIDLVSPTAGRGSAGDTAPGPALPHPHA